MVTHILYAAAGSPPMTGSICGRCAVCGCDGTGIPFADWQKDTFTDYDKLKRGTIVCHACQFSFHEASVELQTRTGKEKLQKMRNYSHFVLNGVWHPLNKGQKQEMRLLLQQSPQVAIIAVSGQKHLIFRSSPGWVQFEEQRTFVHPEKLQHALRVTDTLYQYFSKDEIQTGTYSPSRIRLCGIDTFLSLEQEARMLRGSVLFDIAIFLAQRKDEAKNDKNE